MEAIANKIPNKIKTTLEQVCDPEIPVLSVLDLGIVRDVCIIDNKNISVTITPTYSGCPAMDTIEKDIKSALKADGFKDVLVKTQLSPAWSSHWISQKGKEKLLKYGIAPPEEATTDKSVLLGQPPKSVNCPQCSSNKTELVSEFGSTACKAMYKCKICKEPFDYFKCI